MKCRRPSSREALRGYTLIELLVVMAIITLLAGLMLPAVTHAIVVVQEFKTKNTIQRLEVALAAFHKDWNVFPPSNAAHGGATIPNILNPTGSNYLAYYLIGPTGRGWGAPVGSPNYDGPFGKSDGSQTWGPYYTAETSGIVDGFNPAMAIFYCRAEPNEATVLNVTDNGVVDSFAPPDKNYYSQTAFELLVRPGLTSNATRPWVRRDYVLISAGADRRWGYVKKTSSGDYQAVVTIDADSTCDDIANFTY